MTTDFIYSVEELFTTFFQGGDVSYFNIPPYQRGYKWRSEAVLKLLEDISSFDLQKDSKKFYCLQNITLVKDSVSGFYNVVDGQQRLTTLIVILACLDECGKVQEKVKYSSRKSTEAFISKFILDPVNNQDILENEWGDFAKKHSDLDYQDIFYLHSAYRAVHIWYDNKKPEEQRILKDRILHHVKIIVNLIQDGDEQKLFGNLNGARVQLDGADLVRALIITNVARLEFPDANLTVQQAVQLNEKRVKIGMELDAMTHWWKDSAHLSLFSPAIKAVTRVEDIPFDEEKYPIDGLYKLYALIHEPKKEISLGLFEKNVVENWKGIRYLQRVLSTWTEDRESYHLVGYLLRYSKDPVADVFKEVFWKWNNSTRTQFIKEMKRMIQTGIIDSFEESPHPLFIKDADYEAQCYKEDWYNDCPKDVIKLMVLLDVINIVKSPGKRFLAPEYFVPKSEDKEHIFPQSPLGGKLDTKDKKARMEIVNAYIDLVNKTLEKDQHFQRIKPLTDETSLDDETKVVHLNQLVDAINKVIPINCLGNLCLLAESINRGYGNDFFTEKRIAIISADREGVFIRPHVLDAFDKAWTEKNQDIHHMSQWGCKEILSRRKYIEEIISKFFNDAKQQ